MGSEKDTGCHDVNVPDMEIVFDEYIELTVLSPQAQVNAVENTRKCENEEKINLKLFSQH